MSRLRLSESRMKFTSIMPSVSRLEAKPQMSKV